ncbi:MAG: OmpA family protein, partial [Actinomycetota bacterium]
QSTLDKVVAAMDAYPGPVVDIVGHTDDVGDRSANVELSQRRAAAVEGYLTEQGVDANRLRSAGIGPDEPVDDNDTAEGRANNRRVELTALDSF